MWRSLCCTLVDVTSGSSSVTTPVKLPYPPLAYIQSDSPITWEVLKKVVGRRLTRGISLCVQAEKGHDSRGGYFFHFRRTAAGFIFSTFDRDDVLTLRTEEECVAFINHVCGRCYDETMWAHAQEVNLRTDPDQ